MGHRGQQQLGVLQQWQGQAKVLALDTHCQLVQGLVTMMLTVMMQTSGSHQRIAAHISSSSNSSSHRKVLSSYQQPPAGCSMPVQACVMPPAPLQVQDAQASAAELEQLLLLLHEAHQPILRSVAWVAMQAVLLLLLLVGHPGGRCWRTLCQWRCWCSHWSTPGMMQTCQSQHEAK